MSKHFVKQENISRKTYRETENYPCLKKVSMSFVFGIRDPPWILRVQCSLFECPVPVQDFLKQTCCEHIMSSSHPLILCGLRWKKDGCAQKGPQVPGEAWDRRLVRDCGGEAHRSASRGAIFCKDGGNNQRSRFTIATTFQILGLRCLWTSGSRW